MTDENDPKPSEESVTPEPATPADVVATPAPKAYTTDVVNVDVVNVGSRAHGDDDDDDDDLDEEPLDASRLSPHAVAAFAASLLALFQAPQNVFTAQGLDMSQFTRYVLPTFAVPLLAAIAGIYLAMRGEREIYESDGMLGGVGYVRAARLISIGVLLIAVLAVVLVAFFTPAPPVQQFG